MRIAGATLAVFRFPHTNILLMQCPQLVDLSLHKGMRREEGRIIPLIGIFLATASDEVEHVRTPSVGIGQCRGWFCRDDKDSPQGVKVGMRRRTLSHFYTRNAQTPNVGPTIVVRLTDNLWCHPKGTTDYGFPFINGIGKLGRDTKVCKLDVSIIGKQDVAAFDIAMANVGHAVQIFQSQHNGGTNSPDDILTLGVAVQSTPSLDQVGHTPTLAEFHHDPHFPIIQPLGGRLDEAFKITNDEGRVASAQDVNLGHDLIGLGVPPPILPALSQSMFERRYYFHRNYGVGFLVPGSVHGAEGSLAEEGKDLEVVGPIGGRRGLVLTLSLCGGSSH
mmetsp:Transcript_21347/g.43876  ORF Transcript_21347/g.43876 Transcript_21347/m.43876 type:complete len:333 (-) Transcript_21347:515-1513(-)